jgi:plastocyanin
MTRCNQGFLLPDRRAIVLAGALVATASVFGLGRPTLAADEVEVTISIKDHKFDPAEVKVPAGKAIKLTVKNLDASAEEFESKTLKVEKVIAGKATAVIRLKPLTKGTYKFFGEYHEKTAQGVLIAE